MTTTSIICSVCSQYEWVVGELAANGICEGCNKRNGIVLFGADGTKYVISGEALATFDAGHVNAVPDMSTAEDFTEVQAYYGPVMDEASADFFFIGGN